MKDIKWGIVVVVVIASITYATSGATSGERVGEKSETAAANFSLSLMSFTVISSITLCCFYVVKSN
jgi:hypothetical protein